MKLLKKSLVGMEVALNRKMQVDEGVKVAQKIDALRQTLGKLEVQYSETVANQRDKLTKDLKDLTDQIDNKRLEIKLLERKRNASLAPLTKRWDELKKGEVELEASKSDLIKHHESLQKDKEYVESVFQKLDSESKLFARISAQAEKDLRDVESKKIEAGRVVSEATKWSEDLTEEFRQREQDILTKETAIAIRERVVENKTKSIQDRSKDLDIREAQLKDREGIVDRNFKRLNKQTNG